MESTLTKSTSPLPISTSCPSLSGSVGHLPSFACIACTCDPSTFSASTGFALPYKIRFAVSRPTPSAVLFTSFNMRSMVVGVSWPVSIRKLCRLDAYCSHGSFVQSILRVLRNEATMGLYTSDAERLREVRALLQCVQSRLAVGSRHHTNRGRPLNK